MRAQGEVEQASQLRRRKDRDAVCTYKNSGEKSLVKVRGTQSKSRERGKHHIDCVYIDSSILVVLITLHVHTWILS